MSGSAVMAGVTIFVCADTFLVLRAMADKQTTCGELTAGFPFPAG
jgi:hypothetical protein